MNDNERALCRKFFKLKIHESNGQKFEDLFAGIMNYAEPDFRSIKPWGNIGDRKNDGYVRSRGVYYQVYSPEDVRKNYPDVVKKLESDFAGLIRQWSPVNEFYFVINDKYLGVNADCELAFQSIQSKHNLKAAGFKTSKDLENLLFSLTNDQIFTIIEPFDPAISQLDYSVLSDTVAHVMGQSLPKVPDSSIRLPNWDEKVKFNGLSESAATYLNHGTFQLGALNEFLESQSNLFAEEVKTKMREIYINRAQTLSEDDLFWSMVDSISPKIGQSYQLASIVLLAKYFETCDIFEEPK